MKKLILSIIFFVFFFLLLTASSSVYAEPEVTAPSQKSTSSYNPYCWDTHMGDEMLVCGKVSTKCLQSCTPLASGPREACFKKCNDESTACRKKASAAYRACIEAERQAKKQQETQLESKATPKSILSDPNEFAKYLMNVEDEAKKIVSIKKCGGGLPSQNACIAEKLNSIDMTVADMGSFPVDINTNIPIPIEPVILGKDENREIVGFQQESIPVSVDLLDVTSAGIVFNKESASALGNGTRNAVVFKGEMIETYTPGGRWEPVIAGTSLPPGTTIVTVTGGMLSYNQLNVAGGVGQTSYMTFGGTQTDAASTQAKYDKLFYDLKFGSMTFDTSKSDKNVEVRTPLTITKSKNTKFAVLYDPEKLYAATIIYEGEVEVTDILSDKAMILKPTDEGKPRMVIVPLVKAEEKTQAEWLQPTITPNNSGKSSVAAVPGLIGLFTLLLITLFWYRKKKGSLPWEGKVRNIIEKIKSRKKP